MTLQEVIDRVEEIKSKADDPEAAHSDEDGLWADVLAAIARGNANAQGLAREALKTTEIEFSRWYA